MKEAVTRTLDLMDLAFKDMATAREKAESLLMFDIDFDTLTAFVNHPTPSLRNFARELMLKHFPGCVRFDTLVDFLNSSTLEVRNRAQILLMTNHPGKLNDATLQEFSCSQDERVRALARDATRSRLLVYQS